ncbi:hypothetical protein M6B38_279915 [Iris pallida]|uniref:Uncharacterized protein n=1 Tax=Iris pallida TaxID=29817 RepID=A0AAX6F0J2_IRIPA|nr:hypothetical protein M6B38_162940 [Iris pallida]KAJ6845923.1 hypothetical protein M6B38_279915 [Iris pallida]
MVVFSTRQWRRARPTSSRRRELSPATLSSPAATRGFLSHRLPRRDDSS